MNWKKIFSVLAVVFVIWYIGTQPSAAADTWHTIKDMFTTAADSLSTFLNQASH
jgi:hypothetical protein